MIKKGDGDGGVGFVIGVGCVGIGVGSCGSELGVCMRVRVLTALVASFLLVMLAALGVFALTC